MIFKNKMAINKSNKFKMTLLISFFLFAAISCNRQESDKFKIISTTSLISSIVKHIGKDKVGVVTIVPSGMCPGHFDIKPEYVIKASKAELFLNHGWEKWVPEFINSIENKKLVKKTVNIKENWMVPPVQTKAAKAIARVISEIDNNNSAYYENNLNNYIEKIGNIRDEIAENTDTFKDVKVICSDEQEELLKWLGFTVIYTYGRPEEMSIKEVAKAISVGRKEKVKLVVDNLQSGPEAGLQIAAEIRTAHVTITNFPLNDLYIKSLKENINKLAGALSR